MDFVENLIREKLDVSSENPIERAHRATGHLTGHSDRPRSIIVRFQTTTEERVLQAAWARRTLDFTTQVFKERAKYRQARKQLQERNIQSRILFPAKLKLFEKTEKSGCLTTHKMRHRVYWSMVSTWRVQQENRTWSLLCRLQAETHRSRNRRTPGGELMSDVKTFLIRLIGMKEQRNEQLQERKVETTPLLLQPADPPLKALCSLHSEKLRLFCLDNQQPVCLVCRDSRTHNNHRFRPMDEAAQDLREELQNLCSPFRRN
ncbi:hypothetical protein F7725_016257 [Dissostichus mawsoni]|uniref:B box-type domain-containing protein n=1 Tax=Dissostichus mawsoni TaxID=36200 RepID=A0A7J5Z150_DISMA|nr:hypothetical protein F7725_016257 [Dissostichus mawsoni]